ncbi:hypothetical protein [Spirilliplanes yamanashiensis]|uniref:hypothetical protein n=1 Tax=Spirilliplanes yamanashiensis TaxID=42233 RepID=UPI00194F520E|nr:hypothetical protein [Spirilliplanes yamanashiensis]MDP9819417.1 DNA-binding beta-propeller fold protein YncE [Spirilliplanes yamanashiensis]
MRAFLVLVVVLPGAVFVGARPAAAYSQETVYALGIGGNIVVVLDPAKPNSAEKIIPVAPGAGAIVLSPDGLRAYVAHRGSAPSITVIDTVVGKVVGSVPLPGSPGFITLSPDGQRLWFGHRAASSASFIEWLAFVNLPAGAVQETGIDLEGRSCRIGVTPSLASAVCHTGEATSLNFLTGEVVHDQVHGDGSLSGLVVDPATNRMWVYEYTELTLYAVDARTFAEYDRFVLGGIAEYGTGLAALPGDDRLFHLYDDGQVVTLDRNTAAIQHVGAVPGSPDSLQVGAGASRVYVGATGSAGSTVYRLDTATGVATALLSGLSTAPQGFAVGDVPQLPYVDFQAALAVMSAVGPAYTWTARLRNADARLSAEARATLTFAGTAVEVTGVQAPAGVRCSVVRGGVRCDLGRVPPGGSVPVEVRVRPADGGTVRGTLTVTSAHPDPRPADNTATATAGGRG